MIKLKFILIACVISTGAFAQWKRIPEISSKLVSMNIVQLADTLWISSDYRYYKSIDRGKTWQKTGFPLRWINRHLYDIKEHKGVLYASVFGDKDQAKLYQSFDNGKSWKAFTDGLTIKVTITDIHFGKTKTIVSSLSGIYEIQDRHTPRKRIEFDKKAKQRINAMDGKDSHIIIGGKNKAYESFDTGKTWKPITKGLPKEFNVTDIIVKEDFAYLSTWYFDVSLKEKQGLFFKNKNDNSWQHIPSPVKSSYFQISGMHEACCKHVFVTSGHGLFIWLGDHWQDLTANIPVTKHGSIDYSCVTQGIHIVDGKIFLCVNQHGIYTCDFSYGLDLY